MKNFGVWFKGLAAALLGGAAAAVAQTTTSGALSPAAIKTAGIAGAGVALAAYLTQSPVKTRHQPHRQAALESRAQRPRRSATHR